MMSKIQLFLKLSGYDHTTRRSKFLDLFKIPELIPRNGGDWCRHDGTFGKKYKEVTVKDNGNIRYSSYWNVTNSEKKAVRADVAKLTLSGKNRIRYVKIYGKLSETITTRRIRKDIVRKIKKNACVFCGTRTNIEVDHKNGLMNDKRVLNLKTQEPSDFQAACRHCNLRKRQVIKNMKRTRVRPSCPFSDSLGIDYTLGDRTYDPSDINALVGTYWYDPVKFFTEIRAMLQDRSLPRRRLDSHGGQ